jgi:ligand-binding sensor domain-containing protein
LNAQNPAVTIGDTVSETHDSILIVFEAKNQDLWFGSNGHGVYRYDGKTLLHFSTKDGLCNTKIRGIQEDKTGNIYFNTVGGISKFDGKTFNTLSITRSNSPDKGWKLQADDLWFQGAQDSGVVYRYDGKTLYRLEFPETKAGAEHKSKFPRSKFPFMAFSPYDVYTIYKDSKGNRWFGTSTLGICRYDGKSFSWMYEKELTDTPSGGSFGIRSILEDKEGKFWFCNNHYRYDISPNSYTDEQGNNLIRYRKEKGMYNLENPGEADLIYFMSVAETKNGDLWMVTYSAGVWRYDKKTISHYPVKDSGTIVNLFSIYQDQQGGLWLGTHTGGVYKFNGKTFEKFKF